MKTINIISLKKGPNHFLFYEGYPNSAWFWLHVPARAHVIQGFGGLLGYYWELRKVKDTKIMLRTRRIPLARHRI